MPNPRAIVGEGREARGKTGGREREREREREIERERESDR